MEMMFSSHISGSQLKSTQALRALDFSNQTSTNLKGRSSRLMTPGIVMRQSASALMNAQITRVRSLTTLSHCPTRTTIPFQVMNCWKRLKWHRMTRTTSASYCFIIMWRTTWWETPCSDITTQCMTLRGMKSELVSLRLSIMLYMSHPNQMMIPQVKLSLMIMEIQMKQRMLSNKLNQIQMAQLMKKTRFQKLPLQVK